MDSCQGNLKEFRTSTIRYKWKAVLYLVRNAPKEGTYDRSAHFHLTKDTVGAIKLQIQDLTHQRLLENCTWAKTQNLMNPLTIQYDILNLKEHRFK